MNSFSDEIAPQVQSALTESALRESEQLFARMFETSPYGIVLFNAERGGAIVDCNPAWQQISGWTRAEVLGKTGDELGFYASTGARAAMFERLRAEGSLHEFEVELIRKDGQRRIILLSAVPIVLNGQAHFLGTVQDLTQRLQAEQALRLSEEQLQLAISAGALGIWDIDLRSGVRRWSDRGKAIYGLATNEPLDYERQLSLIHPDDRARVDAAVREFRDRGTISQLDLEHRIIQPNGSLRWVAVRGQAIYDGNTLPVRLIGTVLDITERKQRELNTQFLLTLNETVAHGSDERELMRIVTAQIVEHLNVSGCQFVEYELAKDEVTVDYAWPEGPDRLMGSYRLSAYASPAGLSLLDEGKLLAVDDTATRTTTAESYAAIAQLGIRAIVVAPYLGSLCKAWLSVHDRTPRHWRADELELLRDVSSRVWTRIEQLRTEAALRESEERFSKAFSASPMILTISSLRTGRLVEVNDAFVEITGYTRAETLGKTPVELGIWKNPADREAGLNTIRQGGKVRRFEATFTVKGGERIAVISGELIEIGAEPFVLTVMEDITERKRQEQAQRLLAEAGRVLASSLDHATTLSNVVRLMVPDFADYCAVWLFTDEGPRHVAVAHVDPLMEAQLREFDRVYTPDLRRPAGPVSRVLAGAQTLFLPAGDQAAVDALPEGAARRLIQNLAARSMIIAPLRAHERHLGAIAFVQSVSGRTYDESDVPFAEQVALRAATAIENARLYRETQALNAELEARVAARTLEWRRASEELRELAGHLQSTREEERASIARDLHDDLGQQLAVIKMQVAQLTKRLAVAPLPPGQPTQPSVAELQAIQQLLDDGVASIRALVANLRPQILDDLGLTAAIEWQVQQFQERAGIQAEFMTNVEQLNWTREREMALFRILQESLTNVARHAEATQVTVSLQQSEMGLALAVQDNGRGMSRDSLVKANHFGILGMRERAILLGGGLEIQSEPGAGTLLVVRVPQ